MRKGVFLTGMRLLRERYQKYFTFRKKSGTPVSMSLRHTAGNRQDEDADDTDFISQPQNLRHPHHLRLKK